MRKIVVLCGILTLVAPALAWSQEAQYDDLFTFRTLEEFQPVAQDWAAAYMAQVPKLKVQAEVIEDPSEFVDKIDNEMFTIGPMLPDRIVDRLESSVSPTVHIQVFSRGSKPIYAWADEIMLGQNKLLRTGLELMLSEAGQTAAKDNGFTPLSLKLVNDQRKQWKLKELTKAQYKY